MVKHEIIFVLSVCLVLLIIFIGCNIPQVPKSMVQTLRDFVQFYGLVHIIVAKNWLHYSIVIKYTCLPYNLRLKKYLYKI